MICGMSELIDRSARVSTLELFFDLVFVFTITQLTGVLVAGGDAVGALQVAVMLAVIWWMYDGYAWLTNAIATDLLRFRLLLLGGMGGFLVIALAIPTAYAANGLAFGLGYVARRPPARGDVREGHVGLRGRGDPADRPVQPHGCACSCSSAESAGGRAQDMLWARRRAPPLGHAVVHEHGGLRHRRPAHFVERHGLVIIVALGESIVVVGAGAAGVPLDLDSSLVALLSLALSAALWWLYFRDEERRRAGDEGRVAESRRARLALIAFGYWHYGLAARRRRRRGGLKKAVGRSLRPAGRLDRPRARGRRCAVHGVHGRLPDDPRARRQSLHGSSPPPLRSRRSRSGTEWTAAGELAALTPIVVAALVVEARAQTDRELTSSGDGRYVRRAVMLFARI